MSGRVATSLHAGVGLCRHASSSRSHPRNPTSTPRRAFSSPSPAWARLLRQTGHDPSMLSSPGHPNRWPVSSSHGFSGCSFARKLVLSYAEGVGYPARSRVEAALASKLWANPKHILLLHIYLLHMLSCAFFKKKFIKFQSFCLLWLHWVLVAAQASSSRGERGLPSRCHAPAPQFGGFPGRGAWTVGAQAP